MKTPELEKLAETIVRMQNSTPTKETGEAGDELYIACTICTAVTLYDVVPRKYFTIQGNP